MNQLEDESKPPETDHYGYRADRFPPESGGVRWWRTQGWNGQFDLIPWTELETRKEAARREGIEVYDYDDMCWDG